MSLTFGEVKDEIREYLENFFAANKMSDGKQFSLTDARIETMINRGYRLFCSRARTAKRYVAFYTVADQQDYTLPSDVDSILQVSYVCGTEEWDVREIKEREVTWWRAQTGSPSGYQVSKTLKKISLWPIPRFDGERFKAYCVVTPAALVNDTDTFEIPEKFEHAVVDYAVADLTRLVMLLIPERAASAGSTFQSFMDDFFGLAESCREMIEDRSDTDYQLTLDDGSEDYSVPLVPMPNTDAQFSTIYFGTTPVRMYSGVTGEEVLAIEKNRLYWNKVLLLGADKKQIETANETYSFKGRKNSVFTLKIYIRRALGGATAQTLHGSSYIVSQLDNGSMMVTPESEHDDYSAGNQIGVNVSAGNGEYININVLNAPRAEMTVTARFLGVC